MAPPPDRPPPTEASLHEAALTHLARYAATQAGLRRVLERRIARWERQAADRDTAAEQAEAARKTVDAVIARLVAAGAISDVAFAESRARSLTRAGRSRRAVAAQLAAKGVAPELARKALQGEAGTEVAAALVLARRRRLGPFRAGDAPDEAERRRALGILARAGFPRDVAERALATGPEEAEALIAALRR